MLRHRVGELLGRVLGRRAKMPSSEVDTELADVLRRQQTLVRELYELDNHPRIVALRRQAEVMGRRPTPPPEDAT